MFSPDGLALLAAAGLVIRNDSFNGGVEKIKLLLRAADNSVSEAGFSLADAHAIATGFKRRLTSFLLLLINRENVRLPSRTDLRRSQVMEYSQDCFLTFPRKISFAA
jgi:hypothetical protein